MEDRWFKKGFKKVKFYVENDRVYSFEDIDTPSQHPQPELSSESEAEEKEEERQCSMLQKRPGLKRQLPRPASLNAFDIISFSSGCDLSGLFEKGGEESRFVSGEPVAKIIEKLEEIAKVVKFMVRRKDCSLRLEGSREGEKGPLTVSTEVFGLTPSLVVVEVKKQAGDRGEYQEFCDQELKPRLKNLVYGSAASVAAANVASDTE